MIDGYVSRTCIIAAVLWGGVVALLAGAWWCGLTHGGALTPTLLAATACALSAAAVVAHIRTYAARIMALVRVTSGMESSQAPLRAVTKRDL